MVQFTPGEWEIMRILWKHGALKPAELQELYPRPIKNAAMRAALRVLVEKGHVIRRKKGKAYYYEAKTPEQSALKNMVQRLKEVFYGGSSAALISHLMETEKLSPEDIKELRRVARKRLEDQSIKGRENS
ncbi:MAG: BlaI/MecI/CopY family transcriptional regulator [bacterium]